jgi:hypothetical protein
MSQENVGLIKALYEVFGRGDVPAVLGAMDPAIVWNEAENFPYADKNRAPWPPGSSGGSSPSGTASPSPPRSSTTPGRR